MSTFALLSVVVSALSFAGEPIPLEESILVQVWPDHRLCAEPVCGGWYYSAVVGQTLCPDGSYSDLCYASALDFSPMGDFGTVDRRLERLLDLASEGEVIFDVVVDGDRGLFGVLEVLEAHRAGKVPA